MQVCGVLEALGSCSSSYNKQHWHIQHFKSRDTFRFGFQTGFCRIPLAHDSQASYKTSKLFPVWDLPKDSNPPSRGTRVWFTVYTPKKKAIGSFLHLFIP